MIELRALSRTFRLGDSEVRALRELTQRHGIRVMFDDNRAVGDFSDP